MKNKFSYKYLILMASAYFCTFPIIGLTIQKPIMLFSFRLPCSVLIFPITFVLIDIIAEVYGYAIARQVIWCHVILSIYYNFLLFGVLGLSSPPGWVLENAYDQIFSKGLKFTALFGQMGILIGFLTNAFLLTKLKILTRGKYFWIRSVCSSCIGEFLQLGVGLTGVAIGGLMSVNDAIRVLLIGFLVRIIFISFLSFPASFLSIFLKRSENIDPFDVGVNFNPFIFRVEN